MEQVTESYAKELAEREWKANHEGCQQKFASEKTYVGYRQLELMGRVRSSPRPVLAANQTLTAAGAKAQAAAEWKANRNGCQQAFLSEKSYVGYRSMELRGQIRSKKAARA